MRYLAGELPANRGDGSASGNRAGRLTSRQRWHVALRAGIWVPVALAIVLIFGWYALASLSAFLRHLSHPDWALLGWGLGGIVIGGALGLGGFLIVRSYLLDAIHGEVWRSRGWLRRMVNREDWYILIDDSAASGVGGKNEASNPFDVSMNRLREARERNHRLDVKRLGGLAETEDLEPMVYYITQRSHCIVNFEMGLR